MGRNLTGLHIELLNRYRRRGILSPELRLFYQIHSSALTRQQVVVVPRRNRKSEDALIQSVKVDRYDGRLLFSFFASDLPPSGFASAFFLGASLTSVVSPPYRPASFLRRSQARAARDRFCSIPRHMLAEIPACRCSKTC